MKTWTMPSIDVEAYAANEYVASCSSSGSTTTIHCDFDGSDHGFVPAHIESTANCGEITIPNNAFQNAINYCLAPGTSYRHAKCDSNGHWAQGDQVDVSDFGGGEAAGDIAIELWVNKGNVFYNVYHKQGNGTLFNPYRYTGSGYQNHWVYGTNNPQS